jgi:DNA polymerase-3 subunit beta
MTAAPALDSPIAYTDHTHLTDALKAARVGIPSRPPVPILSAVIIHSGPHGLDLTGYDYETAVQYTIHEVPGPEWKAAVPAAYLADILAGLLKGSTARKFGGTPVALSVTPGKAYPAVEAVLACVTDDGKVHPAVRAEKAHADPDILTVDIDGYQFTLTCLTVADYPSAPLTGKVTGAAVLQAADLQAGAARVAVAAGKDVTLPMLTGVRIEAEKGQVTLVTTDRFRLAIQTLDAGIRAPFTTLIPMARLLAVAKLLPADGLVDVELMDGRVRFIAGPVTATIRVLDTEFVKYRALLPAKVTTSFTVDAAKLTQAIHRISAAVDRGRHLRFNVVTAGDDVEGVRLEAGDDDMRAVSPTITCSGTGASDIHTAFNPAYLLAAIAQATDGGLVSIGLTTAGRPALLAATIDDLTSGSGYRHLVMPARLPG